ncbi:MAG: 16S rRNA (cytidine(1402)-2'-O)-methyltransferase [Bacteroidetes bacterium]|nr:16S rRNA (cytidine(1402)-2'-O)-methyltransferase [Bacteroidota bacterium]
MTTVKGTLFLVPTPIGNLGDMSFRAVEVLKQVQVVLAEDTRTSGRLLQHYQIDTPLESFHQHNEHGKLASVMQRLNDGISFAMVTDAGTPGISDPGFLLSRACREQGIRVECLPGATAFVPALVQSGFPLSSFLFGGFLPQKKGRQKNLLHLLASGHTLALYESPYRLVRLLEELNEHAPERPVSVSREISKKFEEQRGGTPSELAAHFRKHEPKGEIVVVVGPAGIVLSDEDTE